MKTHSRIRLVLLLCLGVALADACAAAPAVGTRVLLQEWSPLAPKQQGVRVVASDASSVSDALQAAWTQARPAICSRLAQAMGKTGAAAGQTLHDIRCTFDDAPVFSVDLAGPGALTVSIAAGGRIEANSTMPVSFQPAGGDPRISVALRARLMLDVAVQPNLYRTLRIERAQFALADATLDAHDLPRDVVGFLVGDLMPYLHGADYKNLVDDAVNAGAAAIVARFDAALAPVNARLRGPSSAMRVAVWGRPDAIVVAFAPRELPPPGGGTLYGSLRWERGESVAAGGCESFALDAWVQTGPAPLLDPSGAYAAAAAPMRKVGRFELEPGATAAKCRYRLVGLAAAWPNELALRGAGPASERNAGAALGAGAYALAGEGGDERVVVPMPTAERNYVIRMRSDATAVAEAAAPSRRGDRPDPYADPAGRNAVEAPASYAQAAAWRGPERSAATGRTVPRH